MCESVVLKSIKGLSGEKFSENLRLPRGRVTSLRKVPVALCNEYWRMRGIADANYTLTHNSEGDLFFFISEPNERNFRKRKGVRGGCVALQ